MVCSVSYLTCAFDFFADISPKAQVGYSSVGLGEWRSDTTVRCGATFGVSGTAAATVSVSGQHGTLTAVVSYDR